MSYLTISLDDELVAQAWKVAESRGVTMDDLVAKSLIGEMGEVAETPFQKIEAMFAYAREHDFRISPPFLTREEANGRC